MIDINNRKFKTLFFWTLVAMFFATSSFLILYSFGYTFSAERGVFVYAGSLTIKSNPQDIDVEIDNTSVTKKLSRINNSFHVNRIRPDEYVVRVTAPDYNTWSKKVTIRSGISTEFWNVLLTRKNYDRTAYEAKSANDFFIAPTKNLIATVRRENGQLSMDILDTEKNTIRTVFSTTEYEFTDDEQENIEWSPQSEKIIIPLKKGSDKTYFIIELENQSALDLQELAETSKVSSVRWDSEDKDVVYYMSKRDLYRLDTKKPEEKKVIAKQISSYDISGKFVYYFQLPNGIVFQTNLDGTMRPLQITTSAPSEMEDDSYRIIVYDKEKIAMKNGSDRLFIFNKGEKDEYFGKLLDDAKGVQFSNDGKKLLFWNNREIYAYFTRDWETQPYRSENEVLSVTRYSQPLDNIQWSDDYEHVIFSVNSQIKISELDQRDNNNIFDIVSLSQSGSKVVSNFSEDRIYFTDTVEGAASTLQSINFPEETGLLGF
ncbi:MAG TPA: hypothetical protein DCX32_00645 [Candidatus Moranbacteria bacterium]|nr:MAG: hypothetical protein UW87_C0006G0024 [Candidatus Moranbacteria bacterium GW2011_GWC2_45_10]KKT95548.1 MAG: hypothetical protein UW95_C0001G0112 [Parcubacteria group bacterium GW2011_GWC1_45_14]HAV11045.1 hypothetical protein [Candidatus Moranbacteria bacterium]